MENLLELVNVSKHFSLGGKKLNYALNQINLTVRSGETLGILGESGCGKSTLAKVIMGVYLPAEGQIFFKGEQLKRNNLRTRRAFAHHAQMIFQDPYQSLDPHMPVKSIIAENLEIHGALSPSGRMQRVYELLEMTGLSRDHAERFPHEFSGGQRQRIGIARALALRPDLIVCDEPISALDHSIQGQIMQLLIRLKAELGLTYLFIAHDLKQVRCISQRIAVMYAGRIVELGQTETLYQSPRHPYTQMLLQSLLPSEPDKDWLKSQERVRGEPPRLVGIGTGCPFAERCPLAAERCLLKAPELSDCGHEHLSACWRAK